MAGSAGLLYVLKMPTPLGAASPLLASRTHEQMQNPAGNRRACTPNLLQRASASWLAVVQHTRPARVLCTLSLQMPLLLSADNCPVMRLLLGIQSSCRLVKGSSWSTMVTKSPCTQAEQQCDLGT